MRWLKATTMVGLVLLAGVALAATPRQDGSKNGGSDDQDQTPRRDRIIVRPDIRLARIGGPQLGVAIRDIDPDLAKERKLATAEGALVEQVRGGSAAEKAGIKVGDVISEFDGERVRSVRQLQRLVADTPAGRPVRLSVLRDGKKMELSATLEPESGPAGRRGVLAYDLGELGEDLAESLQDLPRNFRFYFDDRGLRRERGGEVVPFEWSESPHLPRLPLLEGPAAGRLGIRVQELTPQLAEYFGAKDGVLVTTVNPDTPAAKAGLKAGDVVTSVDEKPVTNAAELVRRLRDAADGSEVALGVVRDRKPMTLKVRLVRPKPGLPA